MGRALNRMGTSLPSLDLVPAPSPRRLTDKEAKTGFYSKYAEERMILRDKATTLPKLELLGDMTSSPTVGKADERVGEEIVKKLKRGAKGSQEAKDFMASIRAKRIEGPRKKRSWDSTKRVLKAGSLYKGKNVFGPMPNPVSDPAYSKPRGRPRTKAFGLANRPGRLQQL
jgi:hypothetical protein